MYGGLAICDLYTLQGIGHMQLILPHLSANDVVASLLLIDISYIQLLTGSTTLFFRLPFPSYEKWMDCGWTFTLWEFLSPHQIDIHIRHAFVPCLSRVGDIAIMDFFIRLELSHHHLAALNACCCFLQVVTLADIVTADGKAITTWAKNGIRSTDRTSSLRWTKQSRPNDSTWSFWLSVLARLETNGKFTQPLGNWIAPTHQDWRWF